MREMKDSGIDWLGKIPANWNIKRLKRILQERNEKNNPIKSTNLLSLSIERGVFPYSEKTGGGNKAKENFEDYKLTYPNDIVLNSMNVVVGAVGKSNYFGCISPVYYTLFSRNDNYNIDYYNEIFQSEAFQKSLWGLGNGIVVKESDNGKLNTIRMRIPMEKLNNVLLPVPTREEQDKIDQFLNGKITEIDNVIAKTKQTIDDYKLYKQSIITKAVTKGLDETVEMKDSGIEWIGEIPKHWNIQKMSKICSIVTDYVASGSFASLAENVIYLDEPNYARLIRTMDVSGKYDEVRPVYIDKNSYDFLKNSNLFGGEIILPNIGASVGDVYIIPKLYERMSLAPNSIMIKTKYNDKYYYYTFLCDVAKKSLLRISASTAQPKFNKTDFKEIKNLVPTRDEQDEIVQYLDKKCIEIDKLIKSKDKIIEELEQYKKSLIYEYVTGKKEVKEDIKYNENNNTRIKINCKDNIFAQAILLCKIIERLNNYNLGRVKAEKTLYLIENNIGFDFDNEYTREVAGPLNDIIYKCESIISKKNKWVKVKNVKKHIEYEILDDFKKYENYYKKYYSDYNEQIEKVINIIKDCDMDKSEMIATLYASWNDFIISKDEISDKKIIKDVRENWNDSKKRFSEKVWLNVLQEMKNIGLVPKGYGNHTIIKE